jgi:hypothetical protein
MSKKTPPSKRRPTSKPKPARKSRAAQALGRLGGSANTDAQRAARQANALKAGRPRRVCSHCEEPVRGGHLDKRLDSTCGVHGWKWQKRSEQRER